MRIEFYKRSYIKLLPRFDQVWGCKGFGHPNKLIGFTFAWFKWIVTVYK